MNPAKDACKHRPNDEEDSKNNLHLPGKHHMEHEESEEECEEGEAERMSVSRCFVFPGNLYFEKAGEFLSFKSSLSLFGVSGETDSKVHSKKAKENNPRKTKGEKAPFSSCMPSLG
jgi:hypothetical protein